MLLLIPILAAGGIVGLLALSAKHMAVAPLSAISGCCARVGLDAIGQVRAPLGRRRPAGAVGLPGAPGSPERLRASVAQAVSSGAPARTVDILRWLFHDASRRIYLGGSSPDRLAPNVQRLCNAVPLYGGDQTLSVLSPGADPGLVTAVLPVGSEISLHYAGPSIISLLPGSLGFPEGGGRGVVQPGTDWNVQATGWSAPRPSPYGGSEQLVPYAPFHPDAFYLISPAGSVSRTYARGADLIRACIYPEP